MTSTTTYHYHTSHHQSTTLLVEKTIGPLTHLKPIASPHYQVYLIEATDGIFTIDMQSFTLPEYCLFFLHPNQRLHINDAQISSVYRIQFDQEFYCIETQGKAISCNGVLFNNQFGEGIFSLSSIANNSVQSWIERIIKELKQPQHGHRAILETYLRMLFVEALQQLNRLPIAIEKTPQHLTIHFKSLIEEHFRTMHRVGDYAQLLGTSPKSLAKRLKLEGSPTPLQIINTRLILAAKRELCFSDKPIKVIAYELGFEDPAYFSRFFTKSTQRSPLQYRREQSSK